jgi:hypothetical protein
MISEEEKIIINKINELFSEYTITDNWSDGLNSYKIANKDFDMELNFGIDYSSRDDFDKPRIHYYISSQKVNT